MKDANESKLVEGSRELALHYMKGLVDVARESFLILDSNLRVIVANPVFYQNFRVLPEQTENRLLYDLGNGQWAIPALKKLLEEILPDKKDVRDYEVKHMFPAIGEKTIVLNARSIDTTQLIILAMEDITVRTELAETLAITAKKLATIAEQKEEVRHKLVIIAKELAVYTAGLEVKGAQQTAELVERVKELERMNKAMVGRELKMMELKKEIEALKKLKDE